MVDMSVRRLRRPVAGRLIVLAVAPPLVRGYLRIYINPVVMLRRFFAAVFMWRFRSGKLNLVRNRAFIFLKRERGGVCSFGIMR